MDRQQTDRQIDKWMGTVQEVGVLSAEAFWCFPSLRTFIPEPCCSALPIGTPVLPPPGLGTSSLPVYTDLVYFLFIHGQELLKANMLFASTVLFSLQTLLKAIHSASLV